MDDNGAALQAYKYRLYWEGGLFFFGEMEQDTRAAIPHTAREQRTGFYKVLLI